MISVGSQSYKTQNKLIFYKIEALAYNILSKIELVNK